MTLTRSPIPPDLPSFLLWNEGFELIGSLRTFKAPVRADLKAHPVRGTRGGEGGQRRVSPSFL